MWGAIAPEAAAIRAIHVSEAGGFGFSRLRAEEQGIEAFGYVAANRRIGAALWSRLGACSDLLLRVPASAREVEIAPEGVRFGISDGSAGGERVVTRLLVAADGAQSQIRSAAGIEAAVEDYDQVAVVANVAADRPHAGVASRSRTRRGGVRPRPAHQCSDGNA